tara:strand:- start:43 stop:1116 length:1074 start_codon:yes stop_codon:yes gene_type:complete
MANQNKWDLLQEFGLPASAGYRIPTGGAKSNEWFDQPNTYLNTLGAQREVNPPVNWDDQPAKLAMSPNMLNDPAFSEYDLSQLRTYEQDPRFRDEKDLGIVGAKSASEFATTPKQHASTAGFTYTPMSPYDPNKVYVDQLNELKMAVGPGAEQTKQGNINKELASTIAHEFRHNLFDQPEYSGIMDAAYNRFGKGNISRHNLEEMINRAADVQLMPDSWLGETLEDYEDEYNRNIRNMGYPDHLTRVNTTKQFHRSAKEFFEKVRRQNLKKSTQRDIQKRKIGMPEHLTRGGADIIQTPPPKKTYISPARPHSADPPSGNGGGMGKGRSPTGRDIAGTPFARGGLIDIPLPGRRRDI